MRIAAEIARGFLPISLPRSADGGSYQLITEVARQQNGVEGGETAFCMSQAGFARA